MESGGVDSAPRGVLGPLGPHDQVLAVGGRVSLSGPGGEGTMLVAGLPCVWLSPRTRHCCEKALLGCTAMLGSTSPMPSAARTRCSPR
jgi:hypothetical protein